MGFVKLQEAILRSSLWPEPPATRIVWITMLLLADAGGVVAGSVGGLARTAVVTREECEAALLLLESEDPDDRSGVKGGRRIERVQGGWVLVNYATYRETRTPGAERTARWRRNLADNPRHGDGECDAVTPVTADRDRDRDHEAASRRGVVVGDTDSLDFVATNTIDRSEIAGERANGGQPATALRIAEAPGRPVELAEQSHPTLAPTRAGRVYRGRVATSGEVQRLDWWRREVLAKLEPEQRRRVPGFTADIAELGPGLARALEAHGEAGVRDVVGWATVECAAGRLSPRHYRALFNGDSFDLRVVEASANIAGEAADQHTVSPELAAAIAKARASVEQNRESLAYDDERRLEPHVRVSVEQDLRDAERRLTELLADSRRPTGAQHRAR